MGIYEANFNVEIEDIGYNNKLTNRAVLKFMQEIACMHSESVGYGLNTKDTTHIAWILLNWKLKVFKRPIWNTKLLIRTWPRSFDKITTFRDFEMYDDNNNLIAIASSKWLILNTITNTIQRITPDMVQAYGGMLNKSVFSTDFECKLKEPDFFDTSCVIHPQRRDIDTNNHVSNLCYLDYAIECLPNKVYLDSNLNNVEIMYKKAVKFGEDILCTYSYINNEHIVTIKSQDNKTLYAIVQMY